MSLYLVGVGLHLVPGVRQVAAGGGAEGLVFDRGEDAVQPAEPRSQQIIEQMK